MPRASLALSAAGVVPVLAGWSATPAAAVPAAGNDTIVHLFQWNWRSIAQRTHEAELPVCGSGGTCQHRDQRIAGMVGFRNTTRGTDVNGWWTNGSSQIAFNRGDRGFAAFNAGSTVTNTFQTRLPAGTYCDVTTGRVSGASCTGRSATVSSTGRVTVTVKGNRSFAIHVSQRLGSSPSPTASPTASPRATPPPPRRRAPPRRQPLRRRTSTPRSRRPSRFGRRSSAPR